MFLLQVSRDFPSDFVTLLWQRGHMWVRRRNPIPFAPPPPHPHHTPFFTHLISSISIHWATLKIIMWAEWKTLSLFSSKNGVEGSSHDPSSALSWDKFLCIGMCILCVYASLSEIVRLGVVLYTSVSEIVILRVFVVDVSAFISDNFLRCVGMWNL